MGHWSEDELKFITLSENVNRKNYTPMQRLVVLKGLMDEYEKIFGKDPGRRIGGWARARDARRTMEGKFLPGLKKPAPNGELSSVEPPRGSDPLDGETPISEESTSVGGPKSFAKLAGEQMGPSYETTKKESRLVKNFTEDELKALSVCEQVTKSDLPKIAAVTDKAARKDLINMLCMNMPVDEAIAKATDGSETTKRVHAKHREEELSDKDWVTTYCARVLKGLQNDKEYRRAATLYRKVRTELAACRAGSSQPSSGYTSTVPTHTRGT